METIPTIEELFNKYSNLYQFEEGSPEYLIDKYDFKEAIISFTKLHVTQGLKEASEKADITYTQEKTWDFTFVDKDSILNAYDLNNIK